MGAGASSKSAAVAEQKSPDANGNAPAQKDTPEATSDTTKATPASGGSGLVLGDVQREDLFKHVHSAIRWQKDNVGELLTNPDAVDCLDEKTGNTPIHIAAQNGYNEIVQMLITKKANVNAKNKKGNTAMHMAMAYDYFDTVKLLLDAGADSSITNDAGHPASKGLEGDKTLALMHINLASTTEECVSALGEIEASKAEIDKAVFIQMCLKKKKALGAMWTADLQKKMGDMVANW